jgi:hypothetical protein
MIGEEASSFFGPGKRNGGVLSDDGWNTINDLTTGAMLLSGAPVPVDYGYGNGKD